MHKWRLSPYLHFVPVADGVSVGWNRFAPSLFILNDRARALLNDIGRGIDPPPGEDVERFLQEARRRRFIHTEAEDPSPREFTAAVQARLTAGKTEVGDYLAQGGDYRSLTIATDRCNLACPYCVNEAADQAAQPVVDEAGRRAALDSCVDQFFARKKQNGKSEATVAFNGGEILTEWHLLTHTIERIARLYPSFTVQYSLNTNLTILNAEMAAFLKRHGVIVSISIDGYGAAHDQTRIMRNGQGTFATVMQNVELFRRIADHHPLDSFQGTFDRPDEFRVEEVYAMSRHGMHYARLAPNLLDGTPEDARKKAHIMGRFLEADPAADMHVSESLFLHWNKRINRPDYRVEFHCPGLSGLPQPCIEFNLTTLHLTQLCGFIKPAALPFHELERNIYHPTLWRHSHRFLRERMAVVLRECMECSLVGLCLGGCILAGIDAHNHLNPAACAYHQEITAIYLRKTYRENPIRPKA